MPSHTEQRLVPYTPEQMFDLVADIDRYPEFLPWVVGSRIKTRSETEILADLIVGFKVFREIFTSKVTMERPLVIRVDYVNGPLKYLYNHWRFEPAGQGTKVDFSVDFMFKSRMFEVMVGALFSEAVHRMVSAFEARAASLYSADCSVETNSSSATRTA